MSVPVPALPAKMLAQPLIVRGPVFGLGYCGLVPHGWVVGPSAVSPHAP